MDKPRPKPPTAAELQKAFDSLFRLQAVVESIELSDGDLIAEYDIDHIDEQKNSADP